MNIIFSKKSARYSVVAAVSLLLATVFIHRSLAAGSGPSVATMKKVIEKMYYPTLNGDRLKFRFHNLRTAKSRPLASAQYTVSIGTRIWPVLASYTKFRMNGTFKIYNECYREDVTQLFYFYKNDFGDWDQLTATSSDNKDKIQRYVPCSKAPHIAALFR